LQIRTHRHAKLAVVAMLSSLLAGAAPWGAGDAIAQVPPGEAPNPSPSVDPSPTPEPPPPSPSPSPEPSPSVDPSPSPSPSASPTPSPAPPVHYVFPVGPVWATGVPPVGDAPGSLDPPFEGGSPNHPRTPDLSTEQLLSGTFSTERLVAAAARLRAGGWSADRIRREVYAPFILVGPASWGDSWHEPRYGPGPIVRQHEGQDVLCRYGAQVLAPEAGTIEFDTGLLGGRSVRLFRPNGGYYYFAHFSAWNDRLSDGDQVDRGDVIGYCGDTGNATVPHVHFGRYRPDGVAIDPMRRLISWLREAESDLPRKAPSGTVEALVVREPGPIVGRSLLDDPLPQASLTAWHAASTEPYDYDMVDLTPVLVFLVLFGFAGRRRARPPRGTGWSHRKGPLLS
jgi:hypothetical protein